MKTVFRLTVGLLCLLFTSRAILAGDAPATVLPAGLEIPANQTLALTLHAKGFQIYKYQSVPGTGKFAWTFKAPEADLFDAEGRKVGRHYAGPTWELAEGGKVMGTVKAKADAPDHNGVAWLLLDAVEASGPVLGKVQSIQRVDTVGGNAPAGADPAGTADTLAQVGKELRVEYTATYKFYVAKP